MTYSTYADVFRPTSKQYSMIYETSLIIGGTLFIALCAQLRILLPFSPVPVTGQTLAVILIGALYGSKRGAMTILLYLSEGSMGLPVFAGGSFGFAYLFGPTGGYLIGFVGAAFITGLLAENGWDRKFDRGIFAMIAGISVIYLVGLTWLGIYVGFNKVMALGLYPFIPGELLKITIASSLLPLGWKLLKK